MKKIPTLFNRADRYVIPEMNPKAAMVFEQPTIARRKYDGTAFMFDGHDWWARRSYKGRQPNKFGMPDWQSVEYDPNTQKTFGWVCNDSSFRSYLEAALKSPPLHADTLPELQLDYEPGTYELIGPKINGNPEGVDRSRLVAHAYAEQLSDINMLALHTLTVEEAYAKLQPVLAYQLVEGAVFYLDAEPIAKIKRKDFDYGIIK